MYHHGWYQVAFVRDLTEKLTPTQVGPRRLVLARVGDQIRAFDADCPHRGAHLGYGGRLENDTILCPFHGYRIGLAFEAPPHGFQVREYACLVVAGLVFARLSPDHDNGFAADIAALAADHVIVPGFSMPVRVAASMVIENGFDNRHFLAVHGIGTGKFEVAEREGGKLEVASIFAFPTTPWLKGQGDAKVMQAPFVAHAYSPGLIVAHLHGEPPYSVITGALPVGENECEIRLSLALPRSRFGDTPNPHFCQYLLDSSRSGLVDDQVMWENLSRTAPHRYTNQDVAVLAFQQFCQRFERAEAR